MKQSRRISPRVPYEETVCVFRADGRGRLYARSVDLSATGIQLVCTESFPVATEVRCTLLLPGGPREVSGRIVRVGALPRGLSIAIAFTQLSAGAVAAVARLVEERERTVLPAKLRVEGMERPLRCEGRVEEGTVRLTAALPFLRLDGGVDVSLGESGQTATGVISRIALDPSTPDGVPRLAVEVELKDPRSGTGPLPATATATPTPPATKLPPPWQRPGPSVILSKTFQHEVRLAQERPPRRRVHGTAEIARRPRMLDSGWPPRPAPAPPAEARLPLAAPARRETARLESRKRTPTQSWIARAFRPPRP
jgi:hypothetical protein